MIRIHISCVEVRFGLIMILGYPCVTLKQKLEKKTFYNYLTMKTFCVFITQNWAENDEDQNFGFTNSKLGLLNTILCLKKPNLDIKNSKRRNSKLFFFLFKIEFISSNFRFSNSKIWVDEVKYCFSNYIPAARRS